MTALEERVDAAVNACLQEAGAAWRKVAGGEWGITAEAGGWPLHTGLARRAGLLRVQAELLPPGAAPAAELLHRNRRLSLVRLASTAAGATWVMGEIPLSAATDPREVDRLLGTLLRTADEVRCAYRRAPG